MKDTLIVNLKKELGLNIQKEKEHIIPIFIPHRGCKNCCVFCNQRKISGEMKDVTPLMVKQEIDRYLNIFRMDKLNGIKLQIAFFGGSFTGLDEIEQREFLAVAKEYVDKKLVDGIRISTRPDYISPAIISLLKEYNVCVVELGVQSMNDRCLEMSKRGHTADDVKRASRLITEAGITLGHQMMIGLPGATIDTEVETIEQILLLKPSMLRIYPVYVLKQSELFDMYTKGEYVPLTLEQAVDRTAKIYEKCIQNNLLVIRVGLQTTEEICQKNNSIVGPVCDNYRERVLSYIAKQKIICLLKQYKKNDEITLLVNKKEINYVVGNNRCNMVEYEQYANVIVKEK